MRLNWITFRSLTYAQRAAVTLERKGITATIKRAPHELTQKGCAYAVIVRRSPRDALRILDENRIPFERCYDRLENGEFREVIR